MPASNASRALTAISLAAIAVWVGGMLALGAIVAPVVFGMVAAPMSADAMTVVFRRFDRVALVCVVVLLLTEVALAIVRKPILRVDVARAMTAAVGGALVLVQALVISPRIESLHRAGAIRGLGPMGTDLESTHKLAELGGKTQAIVALVLIALHVWSLTAPRSVPAVPARAS
jgi:uncharacterized membrane protein